MTTELWELRHRLYRLVADTGRAPERQTVAEWVGDAGEADTLLREMHDRHLVVLDDEGELRMLLPFSAQPTDHVVHGADTSWWANCAWDSLAIPVSLATDVEIEATWIDTGEPVDLAVRDGELSSHEGFIQWMKPAHRWWDDIVDT